jgi:outer membrane immunogenic protein
METNVTHWLRAIGVLAIVGPGCAFAADLGGGPAAPAVNWSGFYAGANAGYLGGRTSATDEGPTPEYLLGHKFSFLANEASVGVQTGYNFQFGALVFGPEVDAGTFGVRGSAPYDSVHLDTYVIGRANYDVTARARVGYAFDRALIYATGGAIFTDLHDQMISYNKVQSPDTAAKAGWVIGGGVEYALTSQWSVKGEYLHYDLGDMTVATSNGVNYKVSNAGDMARIGLNFRFGAK